MKQDLEAAIAAVVTDLFGQAAAIELTRPDEQFGDYATNVALQLAGRLGHNSREIAEQVANALREQLTDTVSEVSIAGPGFINLRLTDQALAGAAQAEIDRPLAGKSVVAEYSDPNPFKILHVGHIYTTIVGDAIANLAEQAGGQVHRVNYGGDVGLHVGKTMWAILNRLGGENSAALSDIPPEERAAWLSSAYVEGNNAYEADEAIRPEIVAINKRVYTLHTENDHDSPFAQLYWTCRDWSYQAFDVFYERLGTKMERYYPESEVFSSGLELVKQHTGTVFRESQGAVVFDGEKHGLHTRVFINRQGIPTYEAKEVGLIVRKNQDYHFDRSIVVTANEQAQYMAVVLKAIEQFLPDLVAKTTYVPHGMVRLAGGVKMSSRLGNIIRATDVLDITNQAIADSGREPNDETMLGALKYAFLKTRIGGDLIYDPKESVSLEGNSGPYLQYAHARACSILAKAQGLEAASLIELQPDERSLLRKIAEYPEVVTRAANELMPHHICTYLYELAQSFNFFYEHNRVLDDPRAAIRLQLVAKYANTLKDGLSLLGIIAPEHM